MRARRYYGLAWIIHFSLAVISYFDQQMHICFVEDSPHPETALRFIDIALVGLRRRWWHDQMSTTITLSIAMWTKWATFNWTRMPTI